LLGIRAPLARSSSWLIRNVGLQNANERSSLCSVCAGVRRQRGLAGLPPSRTANPAGVGKQLRGCSRRGDIPFHCQFGGLVSESSFRAVAPSRSRRHALRSVRRSHAHRVGCCHHTLNRWGFCVSWDSKAQQLAPGKAGFSLSVCPGYSTRPA